MVSIVVTFGEACFLGMFVFVEAMCLTTAFRRP